MAIEHVFWAGRDNERALYLLSDGERLTSSQVDAITRLVLTLRPPVGDDVVLDSDSDSTWYSWDSTRLLLELGSQSAGKYRARLVAYSADQPDGIVYADFPNYTVRVYE